MNVEANKHMVSHVISKNYPHLVTAGGGSLVNQISAKTQPHFDNVMDHMSKGIKGGSTGSGGSIYTGGGMEPQNPKEMYHGLLSMHPRDFEMLREIAAQQLGALPSPMWGQIVLDQKEPLESKPEEYERIINMPNAQAAARMVEAEKSEIDGGGFFKALKHAARKAGKVFQYGSRALDLATANKDLLTKIPGLDKYGDQIGAFLDSAGKMRDNISPMVDIIQEAAKDDATPEARKKLRNAVQEGIGKAVEKYTPQYKDFYDTAVSTYEHNIEQ